MGVGVQNGDGATALQTNQSDSVPSPSSCDVPCIRCVDKVQAASVLS